jgi:hypothetical protein
MSLSRVREEKNKKRIISDLQIHWNKNFTQKLGENLLQLSIRFRSGENKKINKRRWPFFSSISRLKYSNNMENKARKGIKSNPIGSRSYLYRLFRVIARVYFRGGFFACTCEKADDLNVIEKMEMSGPKVIKRPSGEYTSKRRRRWWWRDLDRRADIEAGAIDKVKKERSSVPLTLASNHRGREIEEPKRFPSSLQQASLFSSAGRPNIYYVHLLYLQAAAGCGHPEMVGRRVYFFFYSASSRVHQVCVNPCQRSVALRPFKC